jgi:hypothetical protein
MIDFIFAAGIALLVVGLASLALGIVLAIADAIRN